MFQPIDLKIIINKTKNVKYMTKYDFIKKNCDLGMVVPGDYLNKLEVLP